MVIPSLPATAAKIGKRNQYPPPPGSRAEFVVTTPKTSDQAQLTTQYWDTGPDGDFDPTRTIANVESQAQRKRRRGQAIARESDTSQGDALRALAPRTR